MRRGPAKPPPSATDAKPRLAFSRTQTIRITTGLRHMAVGAFWFSVMSVLVKLAGQRLPSMEIVFFRGILTLAMSYVIVKRAGIVPVLGNNSRLLLQRGVLGAAALACFLFSLTHLPLAEATLIQYMNPVFAILVAHWWFGEKMARKEWIALAASLTGVLLITRPAFLFGGAARAETVGCRWRGRAARRWWATCRSSSPARGARCCLPSRSRGGRCRARRSCWRGCFHSLW